MKIEIGENVTTILLVVIVATVILIMYHGEIW